MPRAARRIALLLAVSALSALLAAPAGAELKPVGAKGLATVGKVRCAAAESCAVAVPKLKRQAIGERKYLLRVLAPQRLAPKAEAPVRVKLGAAAVAALEGRTVKLRLRVTVTEDGVKRVRKFETRLKRAERGGSAATPGGGAAPPSSGPLSAEPPLLARPATAVDVGAVSISWMPRDSWLRYVASGTGPGDGILFGNGALGVTSDASPCPDRASPNPTPLPYTVDFTPRASWFDPVGGVAGIYGTGSVAFKWGARGIDLTAADPEIEINGAASRAIFRFQGSAGTPFPDRRASLVSLDTAGGPIVSNGGRTFTYDLMRGRLTADGVNVFAGFYTPPSNDEFGCVSVSFTTP